MSHIPYYGESTSNITPVVVGVEYQMPGKLYLYRGLPGSGKSTAARKNFDVDFVFEEDDYFLVHSVEGPTVGGYWFDGSMVPEAHKACLWRTTEALRRGYNVAVANTFTRLWEMQPYLDLTPNVFVYRMVGNPFYENVHKVPQDVIDNMSQRFEDYPGEVYV